MEEVFYNYTDTDGDSIKLELNFDLLRVRVFATTYNFNGEIISRNKIVGWFSAKNINKFFKILRNNIGNMSHIERMKYLEFINMQEKRVKG